MSGGAGGDGSVAGGAGASGLSAQGGDPLLKAGGPKGPAQMSSSSAKRKAAGKEKARAKERNERPKKQLRSSAAA